MLNSCYICGRSDGLQEHHILPQASGGKEGPTVWLCAVDHQKAHAQALNFESKTAVKKDLFTAQEWARARNIVGYIQLAIRKNRENPDYNDPYKLITELTKRDVYFLHLLKTDAGYTNLHSYMVDLIRQVIRSKFPTYRP